MLKANGGHFGVHLGGGFSEFIEPAAGENFEFIEPATGENLYFFIFVNFDHF